MQEKLWELEYWAMNFVTGTLESIISDEYVSAVNAQHAAEKLTTIGKPWLRLTGNWFNDVPSVQNHNAFYEKLTQPSTLVEDMTYNEFMDWLELSDCKEDIQSAIEAFEVDGLTEHVKIMKIYLKDKYGDEEENDDQEETGGA